MNHVYRLKRSGHTQQLQPVPENTRSAGKGVASTGKTLGQSVGGTLTSFALSGIAALLHAQQAPPAANMLPQGGVVSRGSASINTSTTAAGNALMTVNQTSNRAVIDWNSFNVGASAKVQFNQPGSNSVVLNQISGNNASQIYGQISANGQVFLSNSNGVYFSPTASVNVGALVATTGKANADDFMSGKAIFHRNGSTGSVVNEGHLSAALGGYIALLAPEVRNQGVIVAQAGTVALASGEAVTLNFNGAGTGLAGITTTPQTIAALVENRSAVLAEGGYIVLSAHAMASLQGSVIRNSGQLSASSLSTQGGKIVLMADSIELTATTRIDANGPQGGGTVLVGGDWQGSGDTRQAVQVSMAQGASIEANATDNGDGGKVVLWSDIHNAQSVTRANGSIKAEAGPNGGNGGQIETSSHWLDTDGIQVSTRAAAGESGIWLLDPYDVTISSGTTASAALAAGVYTPTGNSSVVNATTLKDNLNSGSIEISTTGVGTQAGNIDVTADISWSAATTLKLTASGGITSSNNSIISSTRNDSKVIFNQAGDSTFSGRIQGNLALTKQGVGTLTLTGANTFVRGISLERGDIVLGEGGLLATPALGVKTLNFNNTVDESTFVIDKSGTYVMTGEVLTTSSTVPGVVRIAQGTVQTSSQLSGAGAYIDIAAGATLQNTAGSISISGLRGSGNLVTPSGLFITTKTGITSTFSGVISGANNVTIGGPGVQVFSGTNTYPGPTTIYSGATLRVSNASALGSSLAAGKTTVSNLGTLEIDGGITVAEPLTLQTGAIIRSVSSVNVFSGVLTPDNNPNLTFKVDAGSLNFSDTATKSLFSETWNFFLTGNLNFASAVNGGTLKKIGAGNLTYLSRTGTAVANATGVYVRLYDPTGNDYSSTYGSTPDFTYAFYDAAVGGNLVATAGTGAAAWTGTKPTASSIPATYSLTYASGISPSDSNLVAIGPGASANWTVVPKPITITLTRPDITYNGITSYADLTSGASYTSTAMVGTDKLNSFTRTATLAGGGAAINVAQGGTYTITPSAATMKTGLASNYSFTYTPVTGTVLKAPLRMAADNASILLGQSDPAFTANYTGFVNGETSAALTTPTVTRFGTDSAAGTYANVLRPSASSNNYNITTVNGAFTVVPADTLLIKIANSNNTYGSAPSYSVTSAEYLTGANVLRTVSVTPTGGGHFTYTDGVVGGATTGAFDLVSAASANSDVNNYAISLANFTKLGNNFTSPTPVTQAGNLAVVPLAVTVAAPVVNKVYDGTTAATGAANITNKVAGDDVSLVSVGQYTDNANVGAAHAFSLFGYTFGGAKAANYAIDPANIPALTGNDGAITRAALTLSTSNVVKTYNGNLSVSGASTAPALTVTSGTLYTNASNDDVLDAVSGGTFAFTNANAGTGNKTVTVTGATLSDGNAGGNYTITYANNTTSTINPAALTLRSSNVVKSYNGSLSVAGASTAPALSLTSGSLFANASNGGVSDSVSGGTFAFTNANAGSGNKTVTTTGATVTDGNAGGNYTITYANNTASTITPAALTLSTSDVVKTYNGNLSVAGASTAPALSLTSGTFFTNASNGGALDSVSGGTFAFTSANAGTSNKTVTVTGATLSDGNLGGNYAITYANNTTSTINPAALTISGITASNKVYDSSTDATVSTAGVLKGGLIAGDVVNVSATGVFADKNVGLAKPVTLTSSYSGAALDNYTITGQANASANITVKAITVTGVSANDKVYNTTTAATLTGTAAVTGLAGDVVSATGTGAGLFADKDVGTGKAVTVSGYTLTGTDADNYSVVQPTGLTANITKADLSVTGVAAANKVYNGTTAATLTGTAAVTGLVGDVVSATGTGAGLFADKDVGTGKAVAVSGYTLTGADAGNYSAVQPTGLTANITPANLTVTGITADNKVYNGTTAATMSNGTLVGVVAADVANVTLTQVGTFADKNVGTAKVVTAANTISGAASGNYNLTQPTGLTANITKAELTVRASNASKIFGAAVPTLSSVVSGFVGGESLATSGVTGAGAATTAATSATPAGTAVIAAGLGDLAAGNYSFNLVNGTLTITSVSIPDGVDVDKFIREQIAAFSASTTGSASAPSVAQFKPESAAQSPSTQLAVNGSNQATAQTTSQTSTTPATAPVALARTGVLAVTILQGGDEKSTLTSVAFEQTETTTSIESAAQPSTLFTSEKVVFTDRLTTFLVAGSNKEMVEFQGGMANNRMVIVPSSVAARRVAQSEFNLVLAAAIISLGKESRVMLAQLDGVVLDLR